MANRVLAISLSTVAIAAGLFLAWKILAPAIASNGPSAQHLAILSNVVDIVLFLGTATAALSGLLIAFLLGKKRRATRRSGPRWLAWTRWARLNPSLHPIKRTVAHAALALVVMTTYVVLAKRYDLRFLIELLAAFFVGLGAAAFVLWNLDRRGRALREIGKSIGSFYPASIKPERRQVHFDTRMRMVLTQILRVALVISPLKRRFRAYNEPTALLFVKDHANGHYVLASGVSGIRDFVEKHASTREPRILDAKRLCETYNLYCRQPEADTKEIDPKERVRTFRKDTRGFSSTCGIVDPFRSPFVFDDVFFNCLTFDFEYLAKFTRREEQEKLKFNHVVGIPARHNGQLMGVLLLLSDSTARFVRDWRFYEQFMDELGRALQIGLVSESLHPDALEAMRYLEPFDVPKCVDFRRLIRKMNARFDTRDEKGELGLPKQLLDAYFGDESDPDDTADGESRDSAQEGG